MEGKFCFFVLFCSYVEMYVPEVLMERVWWGGKLEELMNL